MSKTTVKAAAPQGARFAWHGAGHPAESRTCPTCNAPDDAPCVSVVPSFGHGATGAPLRGLHAARVALTVAPLVAETERAA